MSLLPASSGHIFDVDCAAINAPVAQRPATYHMDAKRLGVLISGWASLHAYSSAARFLTGSDSSSADVAVLHGMQYFLCVLSDKVPDIRPINTGHPNWHGAWHGALLQGSWQALLIPPPVASQRSACVLATSLPQWLPAPWSATP